MTPGNPQPIRIDADTSGFDAAIRDISNSTRAFSRVFATSLRDAAFSGRDLDNTLRSIALRISGLALDKAFAPLDGLLSSALSGALSGLSPPASSSPAGGAGLPATRPLSVVMNVNAADAASFRKSETQISALLARAVNRGSRAL